MLNRLADTVGLRRTITTLVGLLIGLELVAIAFALVAVNDGDRAIVVGTASMSPALKPGDLAVVQPVAASAIQPGDIIALVEPQPNALLVPRRVTSVQITPTGSLARTRADRSPTDDPWRVDLSSSPVWRAAWIIPEGGAVYAFAHGVGGQFLLAVTGLVALLVAGPRVLRAIPSRRRGSPRSTGT